jgi:hypothetical protein
VDTPKHGLYCRSVTYQSGGVSESYYGVDALRFVLDENILLSGLTYPANEAYYSYGFDGVLNISNCAGQQPFFVSKPYFLGANTIIGETIHLPPANPSLHDSWMDVEPVCTTPPIHTSYADTQLEPCIADHWHGVGTT